MKIIFKNLKKNYLKKYTLVKILYFLSASYIHTNHSVKRIFQECMEPLNTIQ